MSIVIKKIVIPPTNRKATAFFDALNKTKEGIKKSLTEKPFPSPTTGKHGKTGK